MFTIQTNIDGRLITFEANYAEFAITHPDFEYAQGPVVMTAFTPDEQEVVRPVVSVSRGRLSNSMHANIVEIRR